MKRIFIVNSEKDQKLLSQALNNSKINSFEQEIEFLFLEIGKDLIDKICQIIREEFNRARELGVTTSHYNEVREGEYRSVVSSLMIKWGYQKAGLLEMWCELGVKLARSQCFTNGNKRTALLSMISFCHSCGFILVDEITNKIYLQKWEKLLLDITASENEEFAQELVKDRILLDIRIKK